MIQWIKKIQGIGHDIHNMNKEMDGVKISIENMEHRMINIENKQFQWSTSLVLLIILISTLAATGLSVSITQNI